MLRDSVPICYRFRSPTHLRTIPVGVSRVRNPVRPAAEPRGDSTQLEETPLIDAIKRRADRLEYAFHVPGHKRGNAASLAARLVVGESAFKHDLTEVAGLDFLASPSGVIKNAQQLAAQAFGAEHSWFLVNGTSVGIHAALLATCGPDKCAVLARNCHQSAFAATVFAGCDVQYVHPECDEGLGVAHGVTPIRLKQTLEAIASSGKPVGAILIVSPTYFGACSDVRGLVTVCRAFGVPLIVDEAHGSHFAFDAAFPQAALAAGADIVVQSSHKTLSALTQAAMLHVQGPAINRESVSRTLQLLQSSSPSYLLMASLDAARAHAQQQGIWEEPLAASHAIREAVQQLPSLQLLSGQLIGQYGIAAVDPLRITVGVTQLPLSGFQVGAILEEQHGVVMELATQQVVVFALGIGSSWQDAVGLISALEALCKQHSVSPGQVPLYPAKTSHSIIDSPTSREGFVVDQSLISNSSIETSSSSCSSAGDSTSSSSGSAYSTVSLPSTGRADKSLAASQALLSPRDAFFASTVRVAAADAVNRISAELLCPYPPGVPLAIPGELLSEHVIHILQNTLTAGGSVTGASDSTLATFLVIGQ